MVRYVIAALSVLALAGCFTTATKIVGSGESYAGTVKDGLYYQVCQSGDAIAKVKSDVGITLSPQRLPDGRTGVAIAGGGDTMLAEVQTLRSGKGRKFFLVGYREAGKTSYDTFIVVIADGIRQAFASVVVAPEVEDRVVAADKAGDAAAMRAAIGAAIDNGGYKMMTTYAAAELLKPGKDGTTPMPAELEAINKAVGQPLPPCE